MTDVARRHPQADAETGGEFEWRWEWIAHLVKQHGWTKGAELGVWKGSTFLHLLGACPNLTLTGVDAWQSQPENTEPQSYCGYDHEGIEKSVREQSAPYGDRAVILKDWTISAALQVEPKSLDFVFVDADHSSEAVAMDIKSWAPNLKPGGWMLGHDINWPEVREVVDALCPGYVVGPDNCWGVQWET